MSAIFSSFSFAIFYLSNILFIDLYVALKEFSNIFQGSTNLFTKLLKLSYKSVINGCISDLGGLA